MPKWLLYTLEGIFCYLFVTFAVERAKKLLHDYIDRKRPLVWLYKRIANWIREWRRRE